MGVSESQKMKLLELAIAGGASASQAVHAAREFEQYIAGQPRPVVVVGQDKTASEVA
jgi:hypothetical protein